MSTVNMIAPTTFGGIVEGTPSGTVYTGTPGSVVPVQYMDINTMAGLGFTNASGSASQNALVTGTVGTSPWTYTNNNGYPVELGVTGANVGSITAVAMIRNAVTTAVPIPSAGTLRLSPGDAGRITWGTSAAAYVVIPG